MNLLLQSKCIEFAKSIFHVHSKTKHRHFSFIIRRNKILSVGWNNKIKTHPLARKHGYNYPNLHSEMHVIIRFPHNPEMLKFCKIVNIRLNLYKELRFSKPCKFCTQMLFQFGLQEIWYSTRENKLTQM